MTAPESSPSTPTATTSGHVCVCACLCYCEGVERHRDAGCQTLCSAARAADRRGEPLLPVPTEETRRG